MGPLITQDIIGGQWNFVIAFIIGIGFGFVLEQAGFSSSRKLAGVFYGYDFVVLRVFFVAAITAAVGLLFFSYFDWIDLSLIYVNPIFLKSAIVGGVIMGLGFIIGGFCPGTSVCASAIGKIDAMFFLGGIFLGIFLYGESFSLFKDLYYDKVPVDKMVFDAIGISQGTFVLILILIALAAFYVTSLIEKKVDKVEY